jgi:endonuclease/exonuclease/phosphatase family metal-dependent hydrolase
VRLTMRDVILKRVGSDVEVLRHRERAYQEGLVVEIAGKELDFRRGYQWADVKRGDKKFRFVNTHLEAFSSDMAYLQMQEMLEGPGSYPGTTIIACDCNSDPLNQDVKVGIDTRPHSDPYWLATGEHEFFDTWLQHKPARFGWTSGLSETVDDDTAAGFDHRIDLILARRGDGAPLNVKGGQVTGDELADRDPTTGLWPSDHAGVVMRLRGL